VGADIGDAEFVCACAGLEIFADPLSEKAFSDLIDSTL
jgi:hypothetical protein